MSQSKSQGFTLIELLVVITIIGILAALITVAAIGFKPARTTIKAEVMQIAASFEQYKNKANAYAPNCQTDGPGPLIEQVVIDNLRQHLRQVSPRSQETLDLARMLTGHADDLLEDKVRYPRVLEGGISASEAVVFWLGGFSSDPKYPISGDGGPSYDITGLSSPERRKADPIESRQWWYPMDLTRLGPRAADGYFDETDKRFVEFTTPNGRLRRINFWQYYPAKSTEPFVYFDTSRHPVGKISGKNLIGNYDPPAATFVTGPTPGKMWYVHALKKPLEKITPLTEPQIQFVDPPKFQVFHCGIDGA